MYLAHAHNAVYAPKALKWCYIIEDCIQLVFNGLCNVCVGDTNLECCNRTKSVKQIFGNTVEPQYNTIEGTEYFSRYKEELRTVWFGLGSPARLVQTTKRKNFHQTEPNVFGLGTNKTNGVWFATSLFHVSLIVAAAILLKIAFTDIEKQGVREMNNMAAVLPCALDSLNFAETPIAAIALIASYMQIPIEDVAAEYAAEANNRKAIVTQIFKKDDLTDAFISNYRSKFLSRGYSGEDLLHPTAS